MTSALVSERCTIRNSCINHRFHSNLKGGGKAIYITQNHGHAIEPAPSDSVVTAGPHRTVSDLPSAAAAGSRRRAPRFDVLRIDIAAWAHVARVTTGRKEQVRPIGRHSHRRWASDSPTPSQAEIARSPAITIAHRHFGRKHRPRALPAVLNCPEGRGRGAGGGSKPTSDFLRTPTSGLNKQCFAAELEINTSARTRSALSEFSEEILMASARRRLSGPPFKLWDNGDAVRKIRETISKS
jgi:hypothetical protein